jgi:hypothetical protein
MSILTIYCGGTRQERSAHSTLLANLQQQPEQRDTINIELPQFLLARNEGSELSQYYTSPQGMDLAHIYDPDDDFVSVRNPAPDMPTTIEELQHNLFLDGVGSRLPQPGLYNHWSPGQFDPRDVSKQARTPKFSLLSAAIFGTGWDENVIYAINIINAFYKPETGRSLPLKINIVGWSRGGITSVMLANAFAIDPRLKDIEVNIFAIDPVNGPFYFNPHHYTLPPNVRNFKAIIVRYSDKPAFSPLHRSKLRIMNPRVTRVEYQLMHGVHGTPIFSTLIHKPDRSGTFIIQDPAAALCMSMVYEFLTINGTRFEERRNEQMILNDHEKLAYYSEVLRKEGHNHFYSRQGYLPLRRSIAEYQTVTNWLYVNQEHYQIAKKTESLPMKYS